MSLRKIYYALPPSLRLTARKLVYLPADLWRGVRGQRAPYEPPQGDIYIGSGDFVAKGKHHLLLLQNHIDLQHNDRVLDVGSGIGRTAAALTNHLSKEGKYEGFDVVKKGVDWCNATINKDFPNFTFQYVPLNNDLYNTSATAATDFQFPYEDNSFDKVFLFSVFTHMQPDEIQNYLNEIYRVLKPKGQCLSTFFIYNEAIENQISDGNKSFSFPYKKEGYRLMSDTVKSANIAFDQGHLDQMVELSGLSKKHQEDGRWKKQVTKKPLNEFQDILILEK